MPDLSSIPLGLHQGDDPYHYTYDNIPLKNLFTMITLINSQVDSNAYEIRIAKGTSGGLDARISVALNSNGSLKKSAVNLVDHNIAYHEDGVRDDGPGGSIVSYVRMKQDERDKLNNIDVDANKLDVRVTDQSGSDVISSGEFELVSSDTIDFEFVSPNKIKANTKFPATSARLHFYNVAPVHQNPGSPDFKSFETPMSTPFSSGSLRVFVNGINVSSGCYVYLGNNPASSWYHVEIDSQDYTSGKFSLNIPLTPLDQITIDYDTES